MGLHAPVELSGEDRQKCLFAMPAKAMNLNRHGASVQLNRELLVGSAVKVKNQRGAQVSARVVAQLAAMQGVSTYGIEFVEQDENATNFWGITFPSNAWRPTQVESKGSPAGRKIAFAQDLIPLDRLQSPFVTSHFVSTAIDSVSQIKMLESMRAVAIKKGQTRERAPDFMEMGTLRCEGCGEEFMILHDPTFVNEAAAERQAHWLEKVLAEEHEREHQHADRVQLPD
jgi:hypothetical protein